MKKIQLFILLMGTFVYGQRPVDLVNPLVDAANSRWFFFSSATRPFGMVNLSPDMGTAESLGIGLPLQSKTINSFQSHPRLATVGYTCDAYCRENQSPSGSQSLWILLFS